MAGQEWTTHEIQILEEYYPKVKHSKELLPLLPNRTVNSIFSMASILKIKSKKDFSVYKYNKDFWSNYNPINCYWAGFAAADGSIYQRKDGGYSFGICINEAYHIAKFIKDTDSDYPIRDNSQYGGKTKRTFGCQYNIHSQWQNDLEKNFNIVPKKTWNYKMPTQIPDAMMKYFIMGFIDGDGCWHLSKIGNFGLSFSLATRDILDFINSWVDQNYKPLRNKKRNITVDKKGYYHFSVGGLSAAKMFLDMKTLLPDQRFARKWDVPEYEIHCKNYLARLLV